MAVNTINTYGIIEMNIWSNRMIITTVLLMLEMNQLGKEGEYGYTVWLHWLHCSSGAGEIVK